MIQNDDIDAAVAANIVSRAQADSLLAFAAKRQHVLSTDSNDDERFRFLSGFNDVFLTTGVLFLVVGLYYASGATGTHGYWMRMPFAPVVYAAPVAIWALAELLIGRMRAVLPGIVLSVVLCYFAACVADSFHPVAALEQNERYRHAAFMNFNKDILAYSLAAAWAAALALYARFKFPFALLLVAGIAELALIYSLTPQDNAGNWWPVYLASFGLGLLTFAAAMVCDTRDPMRQTLLADNAFWLHLAAAPLIVHSVVLNTLQSTAEHSGPFAAWIVLTILVLGTIALVIDRRALLVSSLMYLFAAVTFIFNNTLGTSGLASNDTGYTLGLFFIGALVIALGLGWRKLRALILKPFAHSSWIKYLPPIHP